MNLSKYKQDYIIYVHIVGLIFYFPFKEIVYYDVILSEVSVFFKVSG